MNAAAWASARGRPSRRSNSLLLASESAATYKQPFFLVRVFHTSEQQSTFEISLITVLEDCKSLFMIDPAQLERSAKLLNANKPSRDKDCSMVCSWKVARDTVLIRGILGDLVIDVVEHHKPGVVFWSAQPTCYVFDNSIKITRVLW